MAQLPEATLSWLYTVLQPYQFSQRTYTDAVHSLSAYPTLLPRTDVFTHDSGASALLLTLSGTLPVNFRNTAYRFPVKIWIPEAYPQQPPTVYVTPGRDMLVRPGQHVAVDGRVYHPYLRDWSGERASLVELVGVLQGVFAREPPVISKAQQQQYHQRPISGQGLPPGQQSHASNSAGPPLPPPKQRMGSEQPPAEMSAGASTPPPRPPKAGEEYAHSLPLRTSSRAVGGSGPPLPPLPHEKAQSREYAASPQYQNGYSGGPGLPQQTQSYPPGPPVPPTPQQQYHRHPQARTSHGQSPVSPISPPNGRPHQGERVDSYQSSMQQQQYANQQQTALHNAAYGQQQYQQPAPYQQRLPPQSQQYNPSHHSAQRPVSYQQPPQPKLPPPDLLSDASDPVSLTTNPTSAPAPPPNPERTHLLALLSATLTQQGNAKIAQNLSALSSLQAQTHALHSATQTLQSELRDLEVLDQTITTNTQILNKQIALCDRTIAEAKAKPEGFPAVDEILVATSLVGEQLWRVCAEEAGCREGVRVLQRGLERGRVGAESFVKGTRGLGREGFGKMVLARKCGVGLGLEVGGRG